MKHRVYVRRDKPDLGETRAFAVIKRAVRAALEAESVGETCVVSVLLTDDAGIREINRETRDVDAATDVLSFPMNELTEGRPDFSEAERDENGDVFLGDMVMSVERTAAQGVEFGHGFEREAAYLAVHSTLHLLGYDHLDEGPRKKAMRAREKLIMSGLIFE